MKKLQLILIALAIAAGFKDFVGELRQTCFATVCLVRTLRSSGTSKAPPRS